MSAYIPREGILRQPLASDLLESDANESSRKRRRMERTDYHQERMADLDQ